MKGSPYKPVPHAHELVFRDRTKHILADVEPPQDVGARMRDCITMSHMPAHAHTAVACRAFSAPLEDLPLALVLLNDFVENSFMLFSTREKVELTRHIIESRLRGDPL